MPSQKCNSVLAFAAMLVGAGWSFGQLPQYQITPLTLPGATYVGINGPALGVVSYGLDMNSSGQMAGESYRFNAQGTVLGGDAWFKNGNAFQQIGLNGGIYSYALSGSGGGTYQLSGSTAINSGGQVLGISQRYASDGSSLGVDTWLYSGGQTSRVGPSGAGYILNTPTGPFALTNTLGLTDSGIVAGTTSRFRSDGNSLGADAWVSNGSTIQMIGLSGPTYEVPFPDGQGGVSRYRQATAMNASGQVVGVSNRFDVNGFGAGVDTWFFNGSTTQQIGLTGAGYGYVTQFGGTFQSSNATLINDAGLTAGTTNRYNSAGSALGQDAWRSNGTTTQLIGLQGSPYSYTYGGNGGGTFQFSDVSRLTQSGIVAGFTKRFDSTGNSLGQDAWIYDGAQTRQLGLTGGSYAYTHLGQTLQNSNPQWVNSTGRVIGTSAIFNNTGSSIGQDAWYFDGTTTTKIGLSGPGFTFNTTGTPTENVMPYTMNDAGDVIGANTRFTSNGTNSGLAGWFYDPETSTTYPLGPDTYSNIIPEALTPGGVVLGYYSAPTTNRAFYWTEAAGFNDLGALAAGGLSAQGWQNLTIALGGLDFPNFVESDGSPLYIVGQGQLSGRTDTTSFLMTQVPEPAILAILPAGLVLFRSRRGLRSI